MAASRLLVSARSYASTNSVIVALRLASCFRQPQDKSHTTPVVVFKCLPPRPRQAFGFGPPQTVFHLLQARPNIVFIHVSSVGELADQEQRVSESARNTCFSTPAASAVATSSVAFWRPSPSVEPVQADRRRGGTMPGIRERPAESRWTHARRGSALGPAGCLRTTTLDDQLNGLSAKPSPSR